MSSEIGQTDITDRQLIPTGTTPRKSLSREIGEAEVVHSIFGRARVRIIRREDGLRRSLWWTVLAVMLLIVTVQVWFIWQHDQEPDVMQIAPPVAQQVVSPPVSADMPSSAPDPVPTVPVPQPPAAVQAPAAQTAPAIAAPAPVRPLQRDMQTASAVAAPVVPRRVVRPLPAPVEQVAVSAPVAVEAGATSGVEQEAKPEQPSNLQPQ